MGHILILITGFIFAFIHLYFLSKYAGRLMDKTYEWKDSALGFTVTWMAIWLGIAFSAVWVIPLGTLWNYLNK